MADNFLERHREEYERRKAEWMKRKKTGRRKAARSATGNIQRPDDEAL